MSLVYSTGGNIKLESENQEIETLPANLQKLKVFIDKKNRAGKTVTVIAGFEGTENDLNLLGKKLKSKCGTGGTVKNQEIIIQGDFREKILKILGDEGYKAK